MSPPPFSSFPSFSSFPDLDPGPSTRSVPSKGGKEGQHKKHKKSKREEDRDTAGERKKKNDRRERKHSEEALRHGSSRSHSRTRHHNGGNDDERKKQEEDRSSRHHGTETPNTIEGLVYFTDRKGDPLNVQYGGLYAGDISKYRLAGGGRKVLGLSPILAVVHRGRAGIEVAPHGRRKMPTLTDSSSRHLLLAEPKRRILATEDKYKFREIDGFLRITRNRVRKGEQPYREIELAKEASDSDESELDLSDASQSSDDDSDTTPMTSLRSTLKTLEERLANNPQDIPSWLSLLSHTLSTVPITSKNAAKTRADIALSVISRAMSAHPDNGRSRALRLRYMKMGEDIWDESKLRAEWEIAVHVDDIEIWMAWLDWSVRHTRGILDSIVEDATRVLRALLVRGDEVEQLRVLWRIAVAFRDAGYGERAHALFQAQAELLYSMPQRLSTKSFEDQLDALEEFWDSEVPRLGEFGARGWTAWEASNGAEQPFPPVSRLATVDSHIVDPYSKWAASETLADRTHTSSLRTTDEEENSDPYAVIIFSDIRPFLLPLRSQRARNVFRHIWLAFAALHVPGFLATLSEHPEDNADDRWAYSHMVSPSYLASVFPSDTSARWMTADAQAGVLVGREREYGSGFGPIKSWGFDALAPFDTLGSSKWTMWTNEDTRGADLTLVREIFKQCRHVGNGADWDLLDLAFEAAVSLKSAVKVSKSFLADARDSLPHWAAHARLEHLRGRDDDARKVYHTVLITTSQNRPGEAALWWDWAHMEWLARNDDVALQVIIRSAGAAGSGGIATLRAKRHYETLLAQQQGTPWKEREAWIKIAALLELLTSSPQSAVALVDSQLDALQLGSSAHESLVVASLALLYHHAALLRNPTPPALLRERVEGAIEVYPNNTAILGIFLEAEKGQGIWGRVRAMLGEATTDSTRKEKGVARRVAEVWVAGWEKGRWEAEVERVRNGLSAAVEDERTRGSPVLWKLFIAFEMRAGQPERAKKLVFRAVSECPLVKELYLLAFGPLRAVFSARELTRLGDTMAERGVRMRVGLDEVVECLGDEHGEKSSEEDEDEIEYNARELRRLRPY